MKIFRMFLLTIIFLQYSCVNSGVNPNSLEPITDGKPIFLNNDFSYIKKNVTQFDMTYTLKSGMYIPKYKSKKGIYYEGLGMCLIEQGSYSITAPNQPPISPSLTGCGIYIENKNPRTPKVYYYLNPDLQPYGALRRNGVLISALHDAEIRARLKNIQIHIFQPDPETFYKAIKFE